MAKEEKAKPKTEKIEETEGAEPGSGKKKLLLIAAAIVVLIGAGVGGYVFFGKSTHSTETAQKPADPQTKLLFYTLDPPFVANFEGLQNYRFLQIHVRVSTRSQEIVDLLSANDPIIRNDLLMLFSAQNADVLATREGKEKLRTDALELVRKALKTAGGDPKAVDNVLFTSFVMQ